MTPILKQCLLAPGFTPQYKELGQLYNQYSDQGFVILGEHSPAALLDLALPSGQLHLSLKCL